MPPKRAKPAQDEQPTYTHWLIKASCSFAEPETRIEKGVDVKFSIDDLEEQKTTSWEGVRNHEAKKFLKSQMKLGHLCLFYASNCKVPGVVGIAKVCKEGYPDHNAWDPKHPYHDPKSKKDDPTWFMVDVEFVSKLPHPVPLSLLQSLSTCTSSSLPPSLAYLTPSALTAISASHLLTRGRLSVQPASGDFFAAVRELGEKGGWEDGEGREWYEGRVKAKKTAGKGSVEKRKGAAKGKKKAEDEEDEEDEDEGAKKKKVKDEKEAAKEDEDGKRRSKRAKKA
ncbi:hypothetical protein JCM6882_004576 [Rhodosporidiobolus microsporus]